MTTVDEIADTLSVHPGDVRVVLGWLGVDQDDPPAWAAGETHLILNPHGERTVDGLYFPDPDAGSGRTRMR